MEALAEYAARLCLWQCSAMIDELMNIQSILLVDSINVIINVRRDIIDKQETINLL